MKTSFPTFRIKGGEEGGGRWEVEGTHLTLDSFDSFSLSPLTLVCYTNNTSPVSF